MRRTRARHARAPHPRRPDRGAAASNRTRPATRGTPWGRRPAPRAGWSPAVARRDAAFWSLLLAFEHLRAFGLRNVQRVGGGLFSRDHLLHGDAHEIADLAPGRDAWAVVGPRARERCERQLHPAAAADAVHLLAQLRVRPDRAPRGFPRGE